MAANFNPNPSLTPIESLRFHTSGSGDGGEELIFNDGEVYTSILEMRQESFQNSTNFVLLAEVMYIRKKRDDRDVTFSKKAGERNLSFDRTVICRCLNSRKGFNIFAILLGPQRNASFFNQNIELR